MLIAKMHHLIWHLVQEYITALVPNWQDERLQLQFVN